MVKALPRNGNKHKAATRIPGAAQRRIGFCPKAFKLQYTSLGRFAGTRISEACLYRKSRPGGPAPRRKAGDEIACPTRSTAP